MDEIKKKEIQLIDKREVLDEVNFAEPVKEKKEKKKAVYTMKASSGCDFVLNKKTARTSKSLVSVFSQDELFIYDEINDTQEEVTDVDTLKKFFSDKTGKEYVVEPGNLSYAKKGIKKYEVENWYQNVLKSDEAAFRYAIRKNAIQMSRISYSGLSYSAIALYQCNASLFIECARAFDYLDNYHYFESMKTVRNIADSFGIDIAKYYIAQKKKSSVFIYSDFNFKRCKECGFDGRRLIDYLLFDSWTYGFSIFPHTTFFDYLDLQETFYGKIKDKYPKDLETAHNILAAKVQEWRELKEDSPKFEEVMEDVEDFCYSNSFDPFVIRMPKVSRELVEEGAALRHCVASYVEKVNGRDCVVVFLREKSAPDTPYLTVEILPDRTVSQVEGLNRRSMLSEEEKLFLWRWARNKKLKISNQVMTEEEIEAFHKKGRREAA